MFFLKLFHVSILLVFSFYSNTFCGYSNQPTELEKIELDNYIGLDKVQVMSINQPSCYCLCKEKPETKVSDTSIVIFAKTLDNNEIKEVPETLKMNLEDDFLENLRITKVAEGCYILFVYNGKTNKAIYLNKPMTQEVLLLSNKNILDVKKIKDGIKNLNENIDVDFIFKISDIKGLKIYKEPIELKIK